MGHMAHILGLNASPVEDSEGESPMDELISTIESSKSKDLDLSKVLSELGRRTDESRTA